MLRPWLFISFWFRY